MASFGKFQSALRLNQEANYEANWLEVVHTLVTFGRVLKSGFLLFIKGLDFL